MLEDRQEYDCEVINMSPGDLAVTAPVSGRMGERVVAYVDHLGQLRGKIARLLPNGFAIILSATPRKRDKLAAQLTWLANRQILQLPEDRRHGRFAPRNSMGHMILPNGLNVVCRVIDLSLSGAAIGTDHHPARRPRHDRKSTGSRRALHRKWLRRGVHAAAASRFRRR